MKYVRLYATPDGESHFEDVEVMTAAAPGSGPVALTLSGAIAAVSAQFVDSSVPVDEAVGEWMAWHVGPRRQFVVRLAGEGELQASDGEIRHVGPGSVVLVEDTTGRGHRARRLPSDASYNQWIPLAE